MIETSCGGRAYTTYTVCTRRVPSERQQNENPPDPRRLHNFEQRKLPATPAKQARQGLPSTRMVVLCGTSNSHYTRVPVITGSAIARREKKRTKSELQLTTEADTDSRPTAEYDVERTWREWVFIGEVNGKSKRRTYWHHLANTTKRSVMCGLSL